MELDFFSFPFIVFRKIQINYKYFRLTISHLLFAGLGNINHNMFSGHHLSMFQNLFQEGKPGLGEPSRFSTIDNHGYMFPIRFIK